MALVNYPCDRLYSPLTLIGNRRVFLLSEDRNSIKLRKATSPCRNHSFSSPGRGLCSTDISLLRTEYRLMCSANIMYGVKGSTPDHGTSRSHQSVYTLYDPASCCWRLRAIGYLQTMKKCPKCYSLPPPETSVSTEGGACWTTMLNFFKGVWKINYNFSERTESVSTAQSRSTYSEDRLIYSKVVSPMMHLYPSTSFLTSSS